MRPRETESLAKGHPAQVGNGHTGIWTQVRLTSGCAESWGNLKVELGQTSGEGSCVCVAGTLVPTRPSPGPEPRPAHPAQHPAPQYVTVPTPWVSAWAAGLGSRPAVTGAGDGPRGVISPPSLPPATVTHSHVPAEKTVPEVVASWTAVPGPLSRLRDLPSPRPAGCEDPGFLHSI